MLDDPADAPLGNRRAGRLGAQPDQLAPKSTERAELPVDGGQLAVEQLQDVLARCPTFAPQGQDLPDLLQREPDRLGLTDEPQPLDVRGAVQAVPRLGAGYGWQQPDLFVVADRLRVQPQFGGELPDPQRLLWQRSTLVKSCYCSF
jgi:hypothetical protein